MCGSVRNQERSSYGVELAVDFPDFPKLANPLAQIDRDAMAKSDVVTSSSAPFLYTCHDCSDNRCLVCLRPLRIARYNTRCRVTRDRCRADEHISLFVLLTSSVLQHFRNNCPPIT